MKHQTVKTVKRKLDILGLKAPSKLPNTTKTTKPMNKNTIKVVKSQPEVYQDYEGYDMPNRKKAPPGMYTASEAIAVIGIPSTNFYALVEEKTINRVVFPDRKEGYYSKSEVDNYARNLKALRASYSAEKLQFGLALNEDIPAIHALTASVSGGEAHAVPEEVLKAWIRKNPQSVHILRKGTEIVGYISAFSLPDATLDLRLRGKLLNRTIPIDDIMPFTPDTTISLYIVEMA